MSATRPSTWLITGASSGFGAALALAAVKAGHKVIGTTRNVQKAEESCPEFAANGGLWVELDPGHKDAYNAFAKCSKEHNVDVLVNNAGYAFIGGIEDTSEDEAASQMEVNFYGPLRTVQAVLPTMRAKRSGNIVLISSGAGFIARPARGFYSASKFAIEAVHESLSYEVKSFGIKVLIVEPGAFKTPFSSRIICPARHESTGGFSKDYKGTAVEQMLTATRDMAAIASAVKGDPDKAASAILKAVDGGHECLRLPLGPDCVKALEDKIGELQRDYTLTKDIASSTNVDE